MPSDSPNILTIMSDQHNKHFLGCSPNDILRTPNLDRLAAEGLHFKDAYCPAPVCVPSRVSFMTSRYPHRNRAWCNVHAFADTIPTWAHVLGASGYETALIGRMHFTGPDQRHGFQLRPFGEFCAAAPGARAGDRNRFEHFPRQTASRGKTSLEWMGTGTTSLQWLDEQVTQHACAYLREHAAGARQRPFAAVVGLYLPHAPFIAPRDLFEYYYERVDVPEVESRQPESVVRARESAGLLPDQIDPERIRIARAAYCALCELVDRNVGRVLEALSDSGLADDTLVIYTSDHGDLAGEHGLFWKHSFYEGSAGVPLLMRLPGVVEGGRVSSETVNLTDLGATFAEIARSDIEWANDGRSLWSSMRGLDHAPLTETYSEFGRRSASVARMVRSGRWKLWARFDEGEATEYALFDLDADPNETDDLASEAEHRDVRDRLLGRLLDDWDPARACRETTVATLDRRILSAWGRAAEPPAPDQVVFPDPAIESDFERR